MKRAFWIVLCIFTLMLTGCGDDNSSKKEERKKNIMGDGVIKMPKDGTSVPGL